MFDLDQLLQPAALTEPEPLLWQTIAAYEYLDDAVLLPQLLHHAHFSDAIKQAATTLATRWITRLRADRHSLSDIDSLLQTFPLTDPGGARLMSLAEALLRVPDPRSADALLQERLVYDDWLAARNRAPTWLGKAAAVGLSVAASMLSQPTSDPATLPFVFQFQSTRRHIIRSSVMAALQRMGRHFVLGETVPEALARSHAAHAQGYRFSYDMLGEAALTQQDADHYFQRYQQAILALAVTAAKSESCTASMSIKLSALHPRYEVSQQERVFAELTAKVLQLAHLARDAGIALTIDAEEMDRLLLSLQIFKRVYQDASLQGWGQFGLAVQAYSKRALPVLVWLTRVAMDQGDTIPVRLVKGAYWDSEIKLAQQRGLAGYPVYSQKAATDLSYLVCARFLLDEAAQRVLRPQFATHNAQTIAQIQAMALAEHHFEYQRLQGMGVPLYQQVKKQTARTIRIYAPIGAHQELLPYLVRRLLENGANSAFVHQLYDAEIPIEQLVASPTTLRAELLASPRGVPLPADLFPPRLNSAGWNFNNPLDWQSAIQARALFLNTTRVAMPLIDGQPQAGLSVASYAPWDRQRVIGQVTSSSKAQVAQACAIAENACPAWQQRPVTERSQLLRQIAERLIASRGELLALLQTEAGKTWSDSQDEIREAVDYCRYYADQAELLQNSGHYAGRGMFIAISPWNFPLAIFLGQIVAALVTGNTVIAKPAEQTPLIGYRVIQLCHDAGVPGDVLQFIPGDGEIGQLLVQDPRIAGVVFTGSLATAHQIQRTMLQQTMLQQTIHRQSNIQTGLAAFIAETGGQNVMIADSTALPEQIVRDALRSAFTSAGQRCSALRILCVQNDIAERTIALLHGALRELRVGDPRDYATDVGPVIDAAAHTALTEHLTWLHHHGKLIGQAPLADDVQAQGWFIPPTVYEIPRISVVPDEHFGPILHVVRFAMMALPELLEDIDRSGYGLTLAIHSRNPSLYRYIEQQVRVGNCYINRDQIGAVVEAQPFGGRGLSGTGPKAGGPHYLRAFCQYFPQINPSENNPSATMDGET